MSIPKRHHFVPELLLRNFVGADGYIWSYSSKNPEKKAWSSKPKDLLLEGHLYTFFSPDGTRDTTLEFQYSELEGKAAPILARVIDEARKARLASLDAEETRVWQRFFYHQWRRVPDIRETLLTLEECKSELESLLVELEQAGARFSPRDRENFLSEEYIKRFHSNVWVTVLRRDSPMILETIARRGIAVARIRNHERKSLILGSRPVLKITPLGPHVLSDPGVEMWLPIAPDVLIGLGHPDAISRFVELDDLQVRDFNIAVAKQSTQISARSRELVESISRYVGQGPRKL